MNTAWEDDPNDPDQQGGVDDAFIVIREPPTAPPSRKKTPATNTSSSSTPPQNPATDALTLQAYPPLYPDETEESRLQRATAYNAVWSIIETKIRHCLEATDTAVFTSLLELAKRSHPTPEQLSSIPRYGMHRIPTGVVLAGGVNSADHGQTFPRVAQQLRTNRCYTALLQSHDFGKTLSGVFNLILHQFSSSSPYIHFYGGSGGSGGSGNDVVDEKGGKKDGNTWEALATWYADEQVNNNSNNQHPLVIIIDSCEAVPEHMLADLVTVMSQGWARLPVCFILGLTTNANALQAILPPLLIDRSLHCHLFNLATALSRLDTLVRDVLLPTYTSTGTGKSTSKATSTWPGLMLDGPLVTELWGLFMRHYFSPAVVAVGWKVAARVHFESHPLAGLIQVALEGGKEALLKSVVNEQEQETKKKKNNKKKEKKKKSNDGDNAVVIPDAALAAWKEQLSSTATTSGVDRQQIGECIETVQRTYAEWAMALRVMVAAADSVGLRNGFTYWQLYEAALLPDDGGFVHSSHGKELLMRLDRAIKLLRDGSGRSGELLSLVRRMMVEVEEERGAVHELREIERVILREGSNSDTGTTKRATAATTNEEGERGKDMKAPATTTGTNTNDKGKRHERYYSKSSRKEALLSKAQPTTTQTTTNQKKTTITTATTTTTKSPSILLSDWLSVFLLRRLRTPPTQLPGADIFTCRDVGALDALSGAPRHALHTALTRPHLYTTSSSTTTTNTGIGIDASRQEDACVAYQLFDQDPSCGNVAEWFTAFKAVYADAVHANAISDIQEEEENEEENEGGKKMRAGKKRGRGKKNNKRKQEEVEKTGGAKKMRKDATEAVMNDPEWKKEMAARFSQVAGELQFIGLIKPGLKRSRGEVVHRAVHMPAPLLVGDD